MKRRNLLKLCVLAIVAAMTLSLFACGGNETDTTAGTEGVTTEAPTTATTEETTEEKTDVTTEATTAETKETTEAPGTTTTEAPATTTTEAPTTETTEEPTTETTEPAPYEQEIEEPDVNASYYLSMVHEGLEGKPQLYLNGEMDGYYFGTTTDRDEAVRVFLEAAEGGYYMYHVVNAVKVYINIVKNGEYTNTVFGAEPVSVWNYDATLGTMVTACEGTNYFLGTRNDKQYQTFSACDVQYADNYKAVFTVYMEWDDGTYVVDCYHPYIASAAGHVKPACSLCAKGEGKTNEHDMDFVISEGDDTTDYSLCCTICDYVSVSYSVANSVNKYMDPLFLRDEVALNYQINNEGLMFDDTTAFIRYSGNAEDGLMIGQTFWTRVGADGAGYWPAGQLKPIEITGGRYLVTMVRISTPINCASFTIGTMTSEAGEPTYDNYETRRNQTINFHAANTVANEWMVLVIDLEDPDFVDADGVPLWRPDANGTSWLTYLQWTFYPTAAHPFTPETKFDYAYTAIVDDWAEVASLAGSNPNTFIGYKQDGGIAAVDVTTGLCKGDHVYVPDETDPTKGTCTVCGHEGLLPVDSDVSIVISPSDINANGHYNATSEYITATGADPEYVRITASNSGTHMNIYSSAGGGGAAKDLEGSTGKYLLIKYRTDKASAMDVRASTDGQDTTNVTHNGPATAWEVAVIDLSQFANYQKDKVGTTVQIRVDLYGNNGDQYIDIAYVAILEELTGAAEIVTEETFVYYADWSQAGVAYTTATAAPVEPQA